MTIACRATNAMRMTSTVVGWEIVAPTVRRSLTAYFSSVVLTGAIPIRIVIRVTEITCLKAHVGVEQRGRGTPLNRGFRISGRYVSRRGVLARDSVAMGRDLFAARGIFPLKQRRLE